MEKKKKRNFPFPKILEKMEKNEWEKEKKQNFKEKLLVVKKHEFK